MKYFFSLLLSLMAIQISYSQEVSNDRDLFEDILRQMQEEFDQFKNDNEKGFAGYLDQIWQDYELFAGESPYSIPKPNYIPPIPEDYDGVPVEIEVHEVYESLAIAEVPALESIETTSRPGTTSLNFPFYGKSIQLRHSISSRNLSSVKEKDISDAWLSFSNQETQNLLAELIRIKLEMNLNDWGFYQLIDKTSKSIIQLRDANIRTIFRHYALFTCGYGARLGKVDQSMVLLIPFKEMIYERGYLPESDKKFFFFSESHRLDPKSIKSLPPYKENEGRLLSLQIKEDIQFPNKPSPIEVSSKDISIKGVINQNRMAFFKDYPLSDLRIYANAPVDPMFEERILKQLREQLNETDKETALKKLLNFCQSAFEYGIDEEQFGYEKYFFPEEVFYYSKSDCEDRSILFSWLVRKVLNNDVVLLRYPNHIATAVKWNGSTPGDFIKIKGERYILCDPTAPNAQPGQMGVEWKNVTPRVVLL